MGELRARVKRLLETPIVQFSVIGLIVVNGVIIGLMTSPEIVEAWGHSLEIINHVIVGVFVVEIVLRIFAEGWSFFKSGWNIFDFLVVAVALIPASTNSDVLRVLRILRVLRLLSVVRSMRLVVDSLAAAIPGFASIAGLLALVIYIFAVVSTMMFQEIAPDHFGNLGLAAVQHFRLMLGDGWPDVVGPVAGATGGWTWVYFIVFTVIASLVVLNLLIAVVVEAMDRKKEEGDAADLAEAAAADAGAASEIGAAPEPGSGARQDPGLIEELGALRREIAELRADLARRPS